MTYENVVDLLLQHEQEEDKKISGLYVLARKVHEAQMRKQ